MFQILEYSVAPNERVVIDDKLKTQYKGITGMTVWTTECNKLCMVSLELKKALTVSILLSTTGI